MLLLQKLPELLQMLKLGDTNSGCLPPSWQRATTLCDFSGGKYGCVDALKCCQRSPVGEGVSGAHQARLCTNHRLPPSFSLSLRAYLPSDNAKQSFEGKRLVYRFLELLILFALNTEGAGCLLSPFCLFSLKSKLIFRNLNERDV